MNGPDALLLDGLGEADRIRPALDEHLAAAEELRWVQALNAGVDSYPQAALADRGIALTNSSGIHAEQMGQQVLGYLLVFERRIHEGIRQQHAGEWDRYPGGELSDDTLGVVGLGAIGSRVGEYGKRMGMEVVGTKADPGTAPDCADACHPPEKLDAVLDRADYLVVACPLITRCRSRHRDAPVRRR